jgi:hypothetical protein
MDFLSVSGGDKPGLAPTLQNIKFIWIYFVALIAISVVVFGWWYYKRISIGGQKPADVMSDEVETDQIESRMELQGAVNQASRRLYAARKLEEASKEWKEYQKYSQEDEDRDGQSSKIFMKILCAQRAKETGEDFDELIAECLR